MIGVAPVLLAQYGRHVPQPPDACANTRASDADERSDLSSLAATNSRVVRVMAGVGRFDCQKNESGKAARQLLYCMLRYSLLFFSVHALSCLHAVLQLL